MRRIVLLLAVVALMTGCTDYRQISVDGVALESFRFNGTSSATIVLIADVDNPTMHTISVEEVDAVLLREGKEFVRFTLEGTPSAGPETDGPVRIPVLASVLDPISIITAGLDLKSWDVDGLTVDGKMVLCSDGKVRKTVRFRKTPVKDIVNSIKR